MGCCHDWEIKDKTVLPSAYEQMVGGRGGAPNKISAGGDVYFQKTVVLVLACKKCGKLKKFIERGPVSQ